MVCAHCKTENPVGSGYCFNCGRDISKSAEEPPVCTQVPEPATREQIIANVDINGTVLVVSNTSGLSE